MAGLDTTINKAAYGKLLARALPRVIETQKENERMIAELEKLDLKLRTVRHATRIVSPTAYEAGETAGASLAINPGIRGT